MNPSLLDRALSLAPLGVLLYALQRHEAERARMIAVLESDREAFRNERRELMNRVQFPTAMPTATRPIERPIMRAVEDTPLTGEALRQRREDFLRQLTNVGTAALPNDDDDVSGE